MAKTAFLPTMVPVLVLFGRLIQGLSAGVEVGCASVYLAEVATSGRKGFFVAWQSASRRVAVMFAALLGLVLKSICPPEVMSDCRHRQQSKPESASH